MGGKKFLTTGLSSWSSVLMETSVLKPGTGSSMWASRCRKLQPRCDVTNLWSFFQDYRWLAFPCNPWISCLVFQTHRRLVSLQKESAGPRTQPAAAPREPAEPEQEPKPESSKKLIIFLSCSLFPTLMKLQLNAAHWEKTECFWNELAVRPGSGRVANLHTGPDVCCSGWIKCCRLMCDVCLLRQVSTPTDSRMNQQLKDQRERWQRCWCLLTECPSCGRPGFSSKPSSPPSYPRPLRLWPNWTSGTEDWLQTVPALLSSLEMFLEAWVEGVYRIINGCRQERCTSVLRVPVTLIFQVSGKQTTPARSPRTAKKCGQNQRCKTWKYINKSSNRIPADLTTDIHCLPPAPHPDRSLLLSTKWQRVPIILLKAETVVPKTLFM